MVQNEAGHIVRRNRIDLRKSSNTFVPSSAPEHADNHVFDAVKKTLSDKILNNTESDQLQVPDVLNELDKKGLCNFIQPSGHSKCGKLDLVALLKSQRDLIYREGMLDDVCAERTPLYVMIVMRRAVVVRLSGHAAT